jgi:malic enzyme
MDPYKDRYAQATDLRTLGEVIEGADVFLGLSAGGVLKPDMLEKMADNPLIMALANPNPEIDPAVAREVRPTPSSALVGRIIPIRSTMFSASPTSSAGRSMSARAPSTPR